MNASRQKRTGDKRKDKRAKASKKFENKFRDTPPRIVLYNRLPTVPDELDWKVETFGVILPVGATASISSAVFTNSLLHSADAFLGSGQNASLADVASTYTRYRVVGYKVSYTLSPRTTVDTNMTVVHSPSDPSFSSAVSWLPSSVTRDKAIYHLVPGSSKSPCILHGGSYFSMSRIVGQKEYEQELNYAGTIDSAGVFTAPSELTYLTFYQGLVTGTFTANTAVQISLMLQQYVKFYDKRQ